MLDRAKYHFMVPEGVIFGHKIFALAFEVDQTKTKVIEKLPPLILVKVVRSFQGHTEFYIRFVKDLSKITKFLCNLLGEEYHSSLMRNA